MDGGAADEFVLADILAAELSAAASGLTAASSSDNGASPAAAPAKAASSGSSAADSGSAGSKTKVKPPAAAKRNQLPSFRSEIDEW